MAQNWIVRRASVRRTLLRIGESEDQVGIAFIVVFMLAMSRLMSVACMHSQSEVSE